MRRLVYMLQFSLKKVYFDGNMGTDYWTSSDRNSFSCIYYSFLCDMFLKTLVWIDFKIDAYIMAKTGALGTLYCSCLCQTVYSPELSMLWDNSKVWAYVQVPLHYWCLLFWSTLRPNLKLLFGRNYNVAITDMSSSIYEYPLWYNGYSIHLDIEMLWVWSQSEPQYFFRIRNVVSRAINLI